MSQHSTPPVGLPTRCACCDIQVEAERPATWIQLVCIAPARGICRACTRTANAAWATFARQVIDAQGIEGWQRLRDDDAHTTIEQPPPEPPKERA